MGFVEAVFIKGAVMRVYAKNTFVSVSFLAFVLMPFTAFADNPSPVDFHPTVLPILKDSCFACHIPNGAPPYAGTDPVLAKKIKKEIGDALEDFTMSDTFPFPTGDPSAKQLKELGKELSKGFMPPDAQAKLGLGLGLSDKNRKVLMNWVAQQKATQK
jgi:hypothetical protein